MATVGEIGYVDSVMAPPDTDARPDSNGDGAVNEPLVLDFSTMHDRQDSIETKVPLTPTTIRPNSQRSGSWLSDDDAGAGAPPPPDFTNRAIHVPSRTSSSTPAANKKRLSMQRRLSLEAASYSMPGTPESYKPGVRSSSRTPSSAPRSSQSNRAGSIGPNTMRSSADSVMSYDFCAPSVVSQTLAPLQQKASIEDGDRLSPLLEDDPQSFDLISAPTENERKQFSLETRSEQMLSKEHLEAIFQDNTSLLRFTTFLSTARPNSVPILVYYLDALKALRAISYANAVAEALEPIGDLEFTQTPARPTVNAVLEEKANQAFGEMVRNDLPAFITHVFIQVVSVSISKRVTGSLPLLLREASEGLAEVFCLTDPSRTDNPVIFASEEFHRTTQYGVNYAIGRNCRFLQGPKTNPSTAARFKEAVLAGKDHCEVMLNYRRDGSPFMNLLMISPLLDSRGKLRYFIGAQIDVSGLVKDSTDLEAFKRMLDQQEGLEEQDEQKDEFQELSKMFNHFEMDTVKKFGGVMHEQHFQEQNGNNAFSGGRPRLLLQDKSAFDTNKAEKPSPTADGRLTGPYQHYLLIRPAPSLRILFTSPSLRVPGILQSHFLERIGGSQRVRDSLSTALADGSRGVTAKIRWLPYAVQSLENSYEQGRPRWIHCTPLLGASGAVGVWMVVLIDEHDDDEEARSVRRFKTAPPVARDIHSYRKRDGDGERVWDGDTDSSSQHHHPSSATNTSPTTTSRLDFDSDPETYSIRTPSLAPSHHSHSTTVSQPPSTHLTTTHLHIQTPHHHHHHQAAQNQNQNQNQPQNQASSSSPNQNPNLNPTPSPRSPRFPVRVHDHTQRSLRSASSSSGRTFGAGAGSGAGPGPRSRDTDRDKDRDRDRRVESFAV